MPPKSAEDSPSLCMNLSKSNLSIKTDRKCHNLCTNRLYRCHTTKKYQHQKSKHEGQKRRNEFLLGFGNKQFSAQKTKSKASFFLILGLLPLLFLFTTNLHLFAGSGNNDISPGRRGYDCGSWSGIPGILVVSGAPQAPPSENGFRDDTSCPEEEQTVQDCFCKFKFDDCQNRVKCCKKHNQTECVC